MNRALNSFKVRQGNKILDYRLGEDLDLNKISGFFQKNYQVEKIWKDGRHILGILIKDKKYFLKLSTSEGMSVVTKNEYNWNNYFHKYFPKNLPYSVPENYDSGLYEDKFFYLITDYFAGKLLCQTRDANKNSNHLTRYMPQIIALSEAIQKLPAIKFTIDQDKESDYRARFINKTKTWFSDIPADVIKKYDIKTLLKMVEKEASQLQGCPRHGDFTPWHIIKMNDGRLGLIDGEHALPKGVENYDICYFIQRVFSTLENPQLAKGIYEKLLKRGYEVNKLKTVLLARAIGGFLDESLSNQPDYVVAGNFKDWVLSI